MVGGERGEREGERRAGAKCLQPLGGGVGGRREGEEGGGETRREGLVNTALQSRVFFRRRAGQLTEEGEGGRRGRREGEEGVCFCCPAAP